MEQLAAIIMQRCEQLATLSDDTDVLFRPFLSPATKAVHDILRDDMQAAGMSVHCDALGNLIGHYNSPNPHAQTLLLGSHLDTVVNAGKYDGILGVLVGIAVVKALHKQDLPFHVDVVALSEEEGVRFGVPFLGSLALSGQFDDTLLTLEDEQGNSVQQALINFGCDPANIARAAYRDALAYVEVHIEQGPYLETLNQPLGIATAIAGQSRAALTFRGEAGHAGTVPMHLRKDALAAAAEVVLEIERLAHSQDHLVATVGRIQAEPGAINVIAGTVHLTLDVRHPDDNVRLAAVQHLQAYAQQVGNKRHVQLSWQDTSAQAATPLDATLSDALSKLLPDAPPMVSGAGHDAMVIAKTIPSALLFVRSPGGISHHPAERVLEPDVAEAIDAVRCLVLHLAEQHTPAVSPSESLSESR
jgi:allantoate deiminase